ncbi:GGDEF domain-containing protein [Sulfurimonas sp.]|uniref:GGDEF domain-containing protein n=1 Tax=Sulfurimonas sp. TaxID=2022749 RepID=UPI002AB0FC78|nr:GGDEF domain-containing protein [Sulfurimonas sp.]
MNNNETLKIISNETKNSIDQLKIVTPSIYASIFSKFALEHKVDLDDESKFAKELMIMECSNLTNMQTQASKNARKLSENADKAINAIKEKDEEILNEVLKEAKSLRREVEKLKESIYKDELTHTYNRKWLHDNLLKEDSSSFKEAGTIAMIDLNYFKIINDTYGHVVGDKVLIYIANQLKKTRYTVIRFGGDEFIIIYPKNISDSKATSNLNRIREDIISKKLKSHNSSFHVSFSLGVTEFKVDDDINEIIAKADKEMYEDKKQIKKRVTGI